MNRQQTPMEYKNIEEQYLELLEQIMHIGHQKGDRTGTGTKSIFGVRLEHDMRAGFPLLTTKKMATKAIIAELLWFLAGDTNVSTLAKEGVKIWNDDAYRFYKQKIAKEPYLTSEGPKEPLSKKDFVDAIISDPEFATKYGDLGPVYGKMWREWPTGRTLVIGHTGTHNIFGTEVIDQLSRMIDTLKKNPDDRRMMVTAWNPAELQEVALPPCHYGYQVWTAEMSLDERMHYWMDKIGKSEWYFEDFDHEDFDRIGVPRRWISLLWNQRSVDTFLGLPFNIASYALLLEMIAQEVNMAPLKLIGMLGDTHIYNNHFEQVKTQLSRKPYALPRVHLWEGEKQASGKSIFSFHATDITLSGYHSHPAIEAPLST